MWLVASTPNSWQTWDPPFDGKVHTNILQHVSKALIDFTGKILKIIAKLGVVAGIFSVPVADDDNLLYFAVFSHKIPISGWYVKKKTKKAHFGL